MIRRMISFVKLELTGMWKRPLPLAMLLLLGLLSIGLLAGGVQVSAGSTDVGGDKLAINAGFNLAFFDVVVSAIVVPFFAAVICGMPLLVDGDRKIQPLLLSTPLRRGTAISRFPVLLRSIWEQAKENPTRLFFPVAIAQQTIKEAQAEPEDKSGS